MPELPTYERRVGPQRISADRPQDRSGEIIGASLQGFGQGLFDLGQAASRLESSQAEIEFGQAQNAVRQRLNDFSLELNEDPEFMLYEEKYREIADGITADIPGTLKTREAQDKFGLWWAEQREAARFKIAQLSQKKNLEWQSNSLQDTINGIVNRADEFAVENLRSLLEGARNKGLITSDKFSSILDKARPAIYAKQAENIAVSMGNEAGREWLLSDEFPEKLEKYVPWGVRTEIANKLYTQWQRDATIDREQLEEQQREENDQALKDFFANDFLTGEEIDARYSSLSPSQKLRWKNLHQKSLENEERNRQAMGKSNGAVLSYVETEMRAARGKGARKRLEMLREFVFEHQNTDGDLARGINRDDFTGLVDDIDKRIDKIADDGEDPGGEVFRTGMREIVAGDMTEDRMRELGSQLPSSGEASEKSLRSLWRQYKKDEEARRKAGEKARESDPDAISEIDDMLMDWKSEYRDIEARILELKAEGRLTSDDALKKRDYALRKKSPPELLTAKIAIEGVFNEKARYETGDKKTQTYADMGRVKSIVTQEFYEGILTEAEIMERTRQLLRPFARGVFGDIWNGLFGKEEEPIGSGRGTPAGIGNQLTEKDRGSHIKTGETGTELWKKGNTWFRKLPDGTWQVRRGNRWVTD